MGGGGENLTESQLKAQEDEAQRRADEEHAAQLQEQEIAAQAARLRREEEDRRALAAKGQRVHEEILQTKIGDQNVFITSQQNILVAKALFNTIEPMMAKDHAVTPILTRIKAMVTAAAIQHHEEGNQAPSVSRLTSGKQPSGRDRAQGSRAKTVDTRNSINNNRDARNVIDGRSREREEDENHRRNDERERFGVNNDWPPHDNRRN